MKTQTIEVLGNNSGQLDSMGLILTVRNALGNESDIVVGFPGLTNATRRAYTGDALLYETPVGTFDIRILYQNSTKVRFLVTQLSPTPGIGAAFDFSDPTNRQFTPEERERIASSLENAKLELASTPTISRAQIDLIHQKLDEIKEASTRLGRKDWINYTIGALTSMCSSAAFAPDVTKNIFPSVNSAFSWLFANALLLIN